MSERASIYYTKKHVLKNRFFSSYFMLVAFSSPVKFSKSVFPAWNFVQSLKLYYKNNFCQSIVANYSKSDFSTVTWVADSEKIRELYSTEIPSNTAMIKEVNSTAIDSFFTQNCTEWHRGLRAIKAPSYKQPIKLSQLQKTQLNLLTVTFLAM